MKTIFVISDTHGNKTAIRSLKEIMAESDYIVHLGDYARDIEEIRMQYPAKVISVMGNCDGDISGDEKIFTAEGFRILAVHGHRFGVKSSLDRLFYYAAEKQADIVLYGHTHRAAITEENGIMLINPGTLERYGERKTYAYLVLHEKKTVAKIVGVK